MPNKKVMSESMLDKTFLRFSAFIQVELGIKMPLSKKAMLQARLQKRLQALRIETFEEYYEYVFSPQGIQDELPHLIDVITTNKTDFFREPQHFDYLTQAILATLLNGNDSGSGKHLKVWCAGCSTGEEAYTLAMVLNEFAEQHPEFRYSILATDISARVLEQGTLGVYHQEKVASIPLKLRKKYLLQSKDSDQQLVRIVPELRAKVDFQRSNLNAQEFRIRENRDIIFCRNVIIYFDRATQQTILKQLCRHLKPGGYLFTGASETLNGLNLPLTPVVHTVYQKASIFGEKPELSVITLKPAEMYVGTTPAVVSTILGSCVAVTMFNRRLGVAAICHALLPHPGDNEPCGANYVESRKYVTCVIPEMAEKMRQYGIHPREIEVNLFGGTDTFSQRTGPASGHPVGRLNVKTALKVLEAEQLRLKTSHVGGVRGRKILFHTHTGEVLLKRLKNISD